jgi:RNA polymerase sigma-70 factor (ECF subfamily)
MARLATGNRDEALDIVQDAMFKMAQRYAQRPAAEFGALFHTILQSRIRDWYRRKKVRSVVGRWFPGEVEGGDEDPLAQVPGSPSDDPAEQLGSARRVAALDAALQELPLRQQQAMLLRLFEGFDVAQTARIMGCSEGSVKTHFSRAVQSLRAALGEHWP